MSAVLAALLAGAAVLLLRPVPRQRPVSGRLLAFTTVPAVAAYALSGGVPWRLAAPVVIGVLAAMGLLSLRNRRRRAAEAAATGSSIQEACELISGELAAGLPVGRSLAEAVDVWPPLAAAASAHQLGSSVPDALRELAAHDGAGDLRLVAAAWQVATRSGSGLAESLGAVADTVRAREATRRLVRSELASARSTARLMAVLPVLTLAMGSGAGGDPVDFLVSTPLGIGCLAVGLALTVLGLRWIEAIAADVEARA